MALDRQKIAATVKSLGVLGTIGTLIESLFRGSITQNRSKQSSHCLHIQRSPALEQHFFSQITKRRPCCASTIITNVCVPETLTPTEATTRTYLTLYLPTLYSQKP